jgi:hypothetical protein
MIWETVARPVRLMASLLGGPALIYSLTLLPPLNHFPLKCCGPQIAIENKLVFRTKKVSLVT